MDDQTPPDRQTNEELARKNARTGLMVVGIVVAMITLSFASVPLYDLFCRVTGFGGTTQVADALPGEVLERTVRIQFDADTGRDIPWYFEPEQRSIEVQLGQRGITAYTAHNKHRSPTAGTAVYNVAPAKAGKYFHKIQCFCFDEQILGPGQEVSMPVLFFIDPSMNDDPNMNDVHTITLSYTFFTANSKALDDALEAFYNDDQSDLQSGS